MIYLTALMVRGWQMEQGVKASAPSLEIGKHTEGENFCKLSSDFQAHAFQPFLQQNKEITEHFEYPIITSSNV